MSENLRILVFIPARGGSKGVPRKALADLGGLPLIAYTIRDARAVTGEVRVFVSTDDEEIARVSCEHGADLPFLRPSELAGDDARLDDALAYSLERLKADENYNPGILIVMSPTYPFRLPCRINEALNHALTDSSVFNIGSIAPAHVRTDNFWVAENGGYERLHINKRWADEPDRLYQTAMSFNIVFINRSENTNRRIPVMLTDIESIDIDTPYDLELARRVVALKHYPFSNQPGSK